VSCKIPCNRIALAYADAAFVELRCCNDGLPAAGGNRRQSVHGAAARSIAGLGRSAYVTDTLSLYSSPRGAPLPPV